jgi:DNA-binding transcriptional ArsR family regulator
MTESPTQDVFNAIADPTRRELLGLLAQGEDSIIGLTGHFPMSRTAVAKHLHILQDAGLVAERKVGRERRYRLQPAPLQAVRDWLAFYERFWVDKLAALEEHLKNHP